MAQPIRIEPDLQFIKDLQAVGGDSLKKCYQCATCSVACPISPDSNPYPRKEMIWAQWGLKDQLITDIDIWLCHNCNTCSDLCPRGAKPGDLLAALRNMTYRSVAPLGFIGKWMSSPKYLPILAAIPALIYAVIWAISKSLDGTWFHEGHTYFGEGIFPEGEIVYGHLFPGNYAIDPVFVTVVTLVAIMFFIGTRNLLRSFKAEGETLVLGPKPSIIKSLIATIGELMAHSKFEECGQETKGRKLGHMLLFYAFVILGIVTSIIAVGHWIGHNTFLIFGIEKEAIEGNALYSMLHAFGQFVHTPMHLIGEHANPIKWLANLGALFMFLGLTLLTLRRMSLDKAKTSSSYYDWYLLGVIWVVFLTGYGSQVLRWMDIATLAYPMYYLHLIAVFMLFAYLPWSKLGHLVYRIAALTYARYIGRKPF